MSSASSTEWVDPNFAPQETYEVPNLSGRKPADVEHIPGLFDMELDQSQCFDECQDWVGPPLDETVDAEYADPTVELYCLKTRILLDFLSIFNTLIFS